VPTLNDYIEETMKYQSAAKVLLWPEGAVSFASDAERDAAFDAVRAKVTGAYVGVSFEQIAADPRDSSGKRSYKRTGIALVHKDSPDPLMLYYKRHLVPIAETYHLSRASEPAPLTSISLRPPKGVPPSKWDAEGHSHRREVNISASICLDFAFPAPFQGLDARPGLILGPARTWESSVGFKMWRQAKQRAVEVGSAVLWCDGGEGGVSGIGGLGFEDIQQVGSGSWVKTIALQYPFKGRRTLYGQLPELALAVYWLLAALPHLPTAFRWAKSRAESSRPPQLSEGPLVEF